MLDLEKRLSLDGVEVPLVSDLVVLELGAVGYGVFRVRGDFRDSEKAVARFLVGYRGSGLVYPLLSGLVSEADQFRGGDSRLVVRELAAVLDAPAGFFLRHVTPKDVLDQVTAETALTFALPADADYLAQRVPYFSAEGTYRQALEAMGQVWELGHPVWFTLPDGSIWWGDWRDSAFNTDPLELDARLAVERDPEARSLEWPYMPRVRPGLVVSDGSPFLVQRVTYAGQTVRLQWGDAP